MEVSNQAKADREELTRDEILRGRLTLLQPKIGYRFSVDPLLLADFVEAPLYGSLLDIGAGVGIVGLLLAQADASAQVTLVELQHRLASLSRKNAHENHLASQVRVIEGDILDPKIQQHLFAEPFDMIVSCPPYYKVGTGEMNPNTEEALARHEVRLPLSKLVYVARRLVRFRGKVAMVYPSSRLSEVFLEFMNAGLRPTRLRLIYPKPGQPAQRALILGIKGGRGDLVIDPPFFIRDAHGVYTKEAQRVLGEDLPFPIP